MAASGRGPAEVGQRQLPGRAAHPRLHLRHGLREPPPSWEHGDHAEGVLGGRELGGDINIPDERLVRQQSQHNPFNFNYKKKFPFNSDKS